MRKVDDGKRKEKKRMAFLVDTTSLTAVYRPNGYAQTTTAGTPHAHAKIREENKEMSGICWYSVMSIMLII